MVGGESLAAPWALQATPLQVHRGIRVFRWNQETAFQHVINLETLDATLIGQGCSTKLGRSLRFLREKGTYNNLQHVGQVFA